MRHAPSDRSCPLDLWASAPWYEKLGMLMFLGIHALPFLLFFVRR
jgi:hypothetical protein